MKKLVQIIMEKAFVVFYDLYIFKMYILYVVIFTFKIINVNFNLSFIY